MTDTEKARREESDWYQKSWPEDIPWPVNSRPEQALLVAILVELRKMNARD